MHWTTGQLCMRSHCEEYCLEACCIAIQISEGLGYSNFALHSVCRRCKPHESMAFVWTDSWGSKFYYVITSLANTILLVIMTWAISKKMALFWDILSTQKAKFQIWYLSEFLVVLWPKYVTLNKTTLGMHKKGQTKIFVKIPIGLCAQIW